MSALVEWDGVSAGYLSVGGHELALLIRRGSGAPALEGCATLRAALRGQEAAVLRRLQHATSVESFVAELSDLLERQLAQLPVAALPPAEFYEIVIREIDGVGWSSLISLSPALDEVAFSVADAGGRLHTLTLSLPPGYPDQPPMASVALPLPFELRWPLGERPTLASAVDQFRAALAAHQDLWDELDDFDRNAWVLEPKHPGREQTHRRVALGNHCSLQVRPRPTSGSCHRHDDTAVTIRFELLVGCADFFAPPPLPFPASAHTLTSVKPPSRSADIPTRATVPWRRAIACATATQSQCQLASLAEWPQSSPQSGGAAWSGATLGGRRGK